MHTVNCAEDAHVAVRQVLNGSSLQAPVVNSQAERSLTVVGFGLAAALSGLACDDPKAVSDVPQRPFSGI